MISTTSRNCESFEPDEPLDGGPRPTAEDPTPTSRVAQLSHGQLQVLRLVNLHLNSKEIAAQLGISSHTVDQRVRGAIKTLGVTRRSEAARLLHEHEKANWAAAGGGDEASYQRLIHQAPYIDAESDALQSEGAVSSQIRHADRTGRDGARRLDTEQSVLAHRPSLFPWSTTQQAQNTWGVGQRLAAIVGVAILSSLSIGMMLSGLESLSRLLQS